MTSKNSNTRTPNYVVFLEPPTNRGIFERQLRPFREHGYELWCLFPSFSIGRDFKLRKVSATQYDSTLFDKIIPIPALSYFGYPGPISFFYLIIILFLKKGDFNRLFVDSAFVRCRNLVFPLLIKMAGSNAELFCDARGILHDEARLLKRPKLSVSFLYWMERHSMAQVDGLSAVTAGLAAYFKANGYKGRIDMNPPVTGYFRSQKVSDGGASIHKVIFLGTLSPWNDAGALCQLFSRFSSIKDILFLGNSSTDQQRAIRDLAGDCHVSFSSVAPNNVMSILEEYDYGLILGSGSECSLTDRTMVPSKLYEYVEAGLVPILPSKCRSAKKFLRQNDLAFLEF